MIVNKYHHQKIFIAVFTATCIPLIYMYFHYFFMNVLNNGINSFLGLINLEAQQRNIQFEWFKTLIQFKNKYYWLSSLYALLVCILFIILIILGYFVRFKEKESLYGNATFAKLQDVIDRFKKKKGVVLALFNPDKKQNKKSFFLFEDSNQFVLALAPTRCGKGVQVGIPNHLFWNQSLISLDIKGESFAMTSAYRKHILKQKVYVFNPEDPNSSGYNPLYYVKSNTQEEIKDLAQIAQFLYQSKSTDDFWNNSAKTLFQATGLLLTDCRETGVLDLPYSLGSIARILSGLRIHDINKTVLDTVFNYLDNNSSNNTHEQIINARETKVVNIDTLSQILQLYAKIKSTLNHGELVEEKLGTENRIFRNGIRKDTSVALGQGYYVHSGSEKTLSSVMSSTISPITMFAQYPLNKITEKNDFDLGKVRKELMSIYIVVKPNAIGVYRNFITLFFEQLMRQNLAHLPTDDLSIKYEVLLLLDEFPALGKIPAISESIAYMAGYKLKLFLIMQSTNQLYNPDTYGKDMGQTMLDNINTKLIYAPANISSAEEISKILGNKTVQTMNTNFSSKISSGSSFNHSEQSRALFLPSELMEMGDNVLILQNGKKPVLANKFGYFQFKYFANEFKRLLQYKDELRNNIVVPNSKTKEEEQYNNAIKLLENLVYCDLKNWEPIVNSDLLKLRNVDVDTTCSKRFHTRANRLKGFNLFSFSHLKNMEYKAPINLLQVIQSMPVFSSIMTKVKEDYTNDDKRIFK